MDHCFSSGSCLSTPIWHSNFSHETGSSNRFFLGTDWGYVFSKGSSYLLSTLAVTMFVWQLAYTWAVMMSLFSGSELMNMNVVRLIL
jgi:hypothetical protein